MKISKIEVENFRLLKKFSIDLEKELSLIIGKNNTGKTSILAALDKFLNASDKNRFSFDDFNVEFATTLKAKIIDPNQLNEDEFDECGIKMRVFIEYFENDNLANISQIMMDLDPDNNNVVLSFEYVLGYEEYIRLKGDYSKFKVSEKEKKDNDDNYQIRNFVAYLKQNHSEYFELKRKSLAFDYINNIVVKSDYIDLDKENISLRNIINFKFISAKREVTNKEIDKTLSGQTSRIYYKTESSEEETKAIEEFKDRLNVTDAHLSGIYSSLFNDIIEKVKKFGGIKPNESEIEIISTLQHRELLQGNTTVVYRHDADTKLPEHFNGLGYMNLISLIFEIEILIREMKRDSDAVPADINLLFIEEPEAHTHPQMQYVFIKNIKELLKNGIRRKDAQNRELQYIISTHSSHIVADSDFNDIKYLKREENNSVISKNIKDLEQEYKENGEDKNFGFLKQYLTLNRAELFFADKAIFIEGDTERILLPAMMKKIDQKFPGPPLLSQNISIIEVGAHSQIFEKFIDFIGLSKSLIITDIDSYYLIPDTEKDGRPKTDNNGEQKLTVKKCSACDKEAKFTSNNSLQFFHKKGTNLLLDYFKKLSFDWKILRKNRRKEWVSNRKGKLAVIFQTVDCGYYARSFEDAFFHINKGFITNPDNSFPSLKPTYLKKFKNDNIGCFDFSEKAVNKKPSLAIEILLNSVTDKNGNEYSNWEIPAYIKEGLLWLRKD
jgi:predicted ATP-dependent endonuclease of OLD family